MAFLLDQLCVFCTQVHNPVDCTVYPTADARQSRLNELKRCYRCLKSGHIPPQCRDFTGCANCNGATHHHTALCEKTMRIGGNAAPDVERCVFCDKHYESTACRTVSNVNCRKRIVFKKQLCSRCFKQHLSSECQETPKLCDYCGKSTHHKALCRKNPCLPVNMANNTFSGSCIFCGRRHKEIFCNVVTDLEARKKILTTCGRCHSCLQSHATDKCFYGFRCRICRSSEHHQVICPQNPVIQSMSSTPVSPTSSIASTPCSPSSSSSSEYTPETRIRTLHSANLTPISLSPTHSDSSDLAIISPPITESSRYARAREAFYGCSPFSSGSPSGSSANSGTTVKPIGFERKLNAVRRGEPPLQCNITSWGNVDRMKAFEGTVEQRFYDWLLDDYY